MKVIIVGATGGIGRAVLERALAVPVITSIVTLSRRDLPSDYPKSEKVKNVIVKDFQNYSDDVFTAMADAEICIWSLGGRAYQYPSLEEARLANGGLLHAGARQIVDRVAPATVAGSDGKSKFRFVYCSGQGAEQDEDRKLLYWNETRKLKGEAELDLIELEKQNLDIFKVYIMRPGGVLPADNGLAHHLLGPFTIGKGEMAAAFVDVGVNGAETQIVENKVLKARGQEALTKK